jgi:hypothetical protein
MGITWNPTRWLDQLIEQRMLAAGQAMVAVAKSLAAVDTGEMRDRTYFTYQPSTKTLTLHADAPWSLYNEFGTYKMAARPFLRPALNAAGPAFLTGKLAGVKTQIMAGTYNNPNHVPLKIKPHIRPRIAAANAMHNVGATRRTTLTAVHMNRQNEPRRVNVGVQQKSKVMLSSLSKLNRLRNAWN